MATQVNTLAVELVAVLNELPPARAENRCPCGAKHVEYIEQLRKVQRNVARLMAVPSRLLR